MRAAGVCVYVCMCMYEAFLLYRERYRLYDFKCGAAISIKPFHQNIRRLSLLPPPDTSLEEEVLPLSISLVSVNIAD